jgi:hypothetical protein
MQTDKGGISNPKILARNTELETIMKFVGATSLSAIKR